MVYKRIVILILIIMGFYPGKGQQTKYFEVTFPTPTLSFEEGWTVEIISDGYIIAGDQLSSPSDADIHYLKVDLDGNLIWVETVFDSLKSNAFFGSIKNDDFIYYTGLSRSLPSGTSRSMFSKVDSTGNILIQKIVGDSLIENYTRAIDKTFDNGFILGGYIKDSIGNVFWENYIIKVDSIGNVLWDKSFYFPNFNEIRGLKELPDSTILSIGYKNYGLGTGEILLQHLDSMGNLIFDTTYFIPSNFSTLGFDLIISKDEGFIIVGETGYGGTSARALILKIDNTFEVIWTKLYSEFINGTGALFFSSASKILELQDTSLIVCGYLSLYTGVPQPQYHRLLLSKLNKDGIEIWRRLFTFSGLGNTEGYDIKPTPDGGFIIAGSTCVPNNCDFYLIKTNCLGFTGSPIADFTVTWNGSWASFTNTSSRADTCIYYFGDGDSAIVQLTDTGSFAHQYIGTGPWQAYMIAYACGEADTIYQTVYTGIESIDDFYEKTFKIYPNPSSDFVTINYKLLPDDKSGLLIITDLLGRVIIKKELNIKSVEFTLDLINIDNGSYQVIMIINGVRKSVKSLIKL